MPFEYTTNITALVNALKNANTTTAAQPLSGSLTTAILTENIQASDPELITIRDDRLPAIFVRISNKDEDFAGIGPTGQGSTRVKKEARVNYDVIGMYSKDSAADTHEILLNEVYTMSRNIEAAISNDFSLGGTALWAQAAATDFYGPFNVQGGGWVKVVLIKVEAKYLFR